MLTTFSFFLTARRGQIWPVWIATELLKQHNTVSNYSWPNLPWQVCLAVFWRIWHYVLGCNASLYKGHSSYQVDYVLDIVMSGETTAIPSCGVGVARKPTLELSFLIKSSIYMFPEDLEQIIRRSSSWDGTSSHSRKTARSISAAVEFSFFSFLRLQRKSCSKQGYHSRNTQQCSGFSLLF